MMKSQSTIWDVLPDGISHPSLKNDPFWGQYEQKETNPSIHLAILHELYLDLILDRTKTIESRFSVYRRIPYQRIKKGDVVLLKQTSGPIKGIGYVSDTWFFELDEDVLRKIRKEFGEELQIHDQNFWEKCKRSSYATLVRLEHVRRIDPIKFSKRDRNAWAIFDSPAMSIGG